ncbi:MAG: type II toxin-antitoxin system HicA family toxin [Thermoleophilia bacterium]|nr:type II toxin-antitoxin system HicA family toxin [Thermoleophilia bacterium]
MGPQLPSLTAKQLVKLLKRHGFETAGFDGSHQFLRHPDGRITTVPMHAGVTIKKGLMHEIMRQCGLTRDDLFRK